MTKGTSLTIDEIIARRESRLRKLREQGIAYPNDFRRSHNINAARQLPITSEVSLAGRLNLRRKAGKATFANLTDGSESVANPTANDIQLYANEDTAAVLCALNAIDFGDVIGVTGTLFTTRKGELTVQLTSLRILSKCLQPFSSKDAPSGDRLRKRRYLALAIQPARRALFRARAKLISALREFLEVQHGFLEVETPMLHQVQGGAAAKPFVTHHGALDQQLYLRIAPELYLKRLLVGGFDRVYEINRSFRNEGMSEQHNPEFTMLEFYAAYQNYTDFMNLLEKMLHWLTIGCGISWRQLAGKGGNSEPGVIGLGEERIDFNLPFARMTLTQALAQHFACNEDKVHAADFLVEQLATTAGTKAEQAQAAGDIGKLQLIAFEKFVEATLLQPTFITAYPASVSPLSRRCDEQQAGRPALVDRFELFIGGKELANGFSELNDPESQAQVFREQITQRQAGNEEAMQYDEDYIKALRYGLPPAAGLGLGIDRLAMLLFGEISIRDVILFPQQRPEAPTVD